MAAVWEATNKDTVRERHEIRCRKCHLLFWFGKLYCGLFFLILLFVLLYFFPGLGRSFNNKTMCGDNFVLQGIWSLALSRSRWYKCKAGIKVCTCITPVPPRGSSPTCQKWSRTKLQPLQQNCAHHRRKPKVAVVTALTPLSWEQYSGTYKEIAVKYNLKGNKRPSYVQSVWEVKSGRISGKFEVVVLTGTS